MNSTRIMLIQDDAVAAKPILEALANSVAASFQVEWVTRCSDALEKLTGIDAILVDLYLPDSHGIETFHRLFGEANKIPILVLIDPADEDTAKLAVQCGAQHYLLKGHVDAYLLPKAIGSMVERAFYAEEWLYETQCALVRPDPIGDAVVKRREPVENPTPVAIREEKTIALAPNCVPFSCDGVESAIEDSTSPFLTNRILFFDRLQEAIKLSNRHHRKLAVIFLDLDDFKHINDSLGHTVGDQLLQAVARRLSTCIRSPDTVSRQDGDEFVVLIWEVREANDAAMTAANILRVLRLPYQIADYELHITASIGIATCPDNGTDAKTLLKRAELAMFHAKKKGRDSFFKSPIWT